MLGKKALYWLSHHPQSTYCWSNVVLWLVSALVSLSLWFTYFQPISLKLSSVPYTSHLHCQKSVYLLGWLAGKPQGFTCVHPPLHRDYKIVTPGLALSHMDSEGRTHFPVCAASLLLNNLSPQTKKMCFLEEEYFEITHLWFQVFLISTILLSVSAMKPVYQDEQKIHVLWNLSSCRFPYR